MGKILNILAIDDHAVVLEGYHFMFKTLDLNYDSLNFIKASDGQSGFDVVNNYKSTPFDIALIDYSIPKYPEKKINSGKDLAVQVRKVMPDCKIIMLTMHRESDIIAGILKEVNPEGFINKSDCTTEELCEAFSTVLNNKYYYSTTVKNYLTRKEKGIVLEDIDIRIILLLSKGVESNGLSSYIPLSNQDIQKHKQKIKKLLNVDGDDAELIATAKKEGYI